MGMKKIVVFLILFAGVVENNALGVTIIKDPGFTTSVMIEDFNGAIDSSFDNHSLDFESIRGGMGQYSFAAGGSATEAYASFDSATTFDPAVHMSIRMRMNSDRSNGEDGDIDVFPLPVQADGRIRYNNYPDGTTLREASWDLGSASPTTPFNGVGIRVDPFNYNNVMGTDTWNVDYIIADRGQSRGAEFDSQDDLSRYLLRGIDSISLSGTVFSGTSTNGDSQIHLHAGIGINADTYGYVEFRVKSTAGTEIKWFWDTAASEVTGVVLEPAVLNDGEWHTYFLDMTDETGWAGALTYNRLDPVDAAGVSFAVDYVRFLSVLPEVDYNEWAGGWGVDIGSETNDYDLDGVSNLYEFGLDGDPTNEFVQGTLPAYSIVEEGGSNVLRCVHPQRAVPGSGLAYSLALSTNLADGGWTTQTGYVIKGTNVTGGKLNFVTNVTNMVDRQKYLRLMIDNRRFTLWQLPSQGAGQMMSYVLGSEGGKVVVIDGGRALDGNYLKGFLADHGNHVDSWFITHPHEDHIDALTWILNNQDLLEIDNIYASFPPLDWVQQYELGTAPNLQSFYTALDNAGRSYTDVNPGDVFDIDEIHIEILSVENTEITTNAVNNSSMMLRVSDSEKSVLFLGDIGLESGNKQLGLVEHQKLKADYVQMAHHGNYGVSEVFYQVIQPQYGLWPTPLWLWNNAKGGVYDSGPWTTLETRQWMEDLNVKSNYVSGISGLIEIK